MLDKIRIQRKINLMVDEMVNDTLSLLPADETICYESERAQFISNGAIDPDSIYCDRKSMDLEYKEGIEDLICNLKKDIVSNHTISIVISDDKEPLVVISKEELMTFRNELNRVQDKLWCEVYAKFKIAR